MAESTFGLKSVNDGKMVERIRRGGKVTLETAEAIRGFIAKNRRTISPEPAVQA